MEFIACQFVLSFTLTHAAPIWWVFVSINFPLATTFDIDWLTSCLLDCRTHGMMDALIKIRIMITFSWGNFQFSLFVNVRCYFSSACVCVELYQFSWSPYGRWLFKTVVNDVYQYNVMIVIDGTLSRTNDCHRMCVCVCARVFCVNAMDWKSGNSIPIVLCTKRRPHLLAHALYLTHSAQVDFMYFFLWTLDRIGEAFMCVYRR